MINFLIKKLLLVFLLISLMGFLFLPEIALSELSPEEIIKIQDKIELKEKDVKDILHSLIQKITDEWISVTASSDLNLEEQAILVILSPSIKKDLGNYLFWEVPKEIGKDIITVTIKVARLILAEDPALIIEEIEKITVEKAKEYAMNWLLQKEIRVATGNLKDSYLSYSGDWEKILLSYIIVYHPLESNLGEVGIGVYSSESIRTPIPTRAYPWEGGIEKLSPFIFRIKGKVEKTDSGYRWIEGPQFDLEFPKQVPKFEFSEPGFLEKIKNDLNKTKIALERASEKIKKIGEDVKNFAENLWQKLKETISQFNPFGAVSNFFSQFGNKKTVALESSLKETESELEKLRNEISLLEEKLKNGEELNTNQKEKYESEVAKLTGKIDSLAGTIDEFDAKISELSEKEKITQQSSEQQKEQSKETKQEIIFCQKIEGDSPKRNKIIFNEVAWMGTENSSSDEWVESKNISSSEINLAGWQLLDKDGQIKIIFSSGERFSANGFYLLERTDDDSAPGVLANKIYSGALNDANEALYLFNEKCELQDEILANPNWPAGDKSSKRPMERKSDFSWQTSANVGGTPKKENSSGYYLASGGGGGSSGGSSGGGSSGGGGGGGGTSPAPTSSPTYCSQENLSSPTHQSVIINEVAWMGTSASSSNEWIELKNISNNEINLAGWQLLDKDSEIKIIFSSGERFSANGFYLLERTDDNSVPGILADKIYTGNLEDTNESLRLFDQNCNLTDEVIANPNWPAGSIEERRSMERVQNLTWQTYFGETPDSISGLMATPKAENSAEVGTPQSPQTQLILITEVFFDIEGSDEGKEFVELYNHSDSKINISGWSLQYLSSSATSVESIKRKNFEVVNEINTKSYFLIGLNGREGDLSWSQALGNNGGTVFLVNNQGPESNISGPDDENVMDKVGYGSGEGLILAEGTAVSLEGFEPGKSIGRKLNFQTQKYQDTDNNQEDFEIQPPTPKSKNQTIEESGSPFEIIVSGADTVWNLNLTTASADVKDSTDASPQNLLVVFVSHADIAWNLDYPTVSLNIIDSTDAPPQVLPEAFVSGSEVFWDINLEESF